MTKKDTSKIYEGRKFGRLTVLERSTKIVPKNVVWICKCDCGEIIEVTASSLRRGNTKSCGCLRREMMSNKPHDHHLCKSRLYVVWTQMKNRCYDSKNAKYKDYGARGITITDEWLGKDGFITFYKWAYANGYDDSVPKGQCTLDRIDVNGNYEPSNCRWVSNDVQALNKQNTVYLTIDGVTKPLIVWCREYGVNDSMVRRRIYKGMDAYEALTKPSRAKSKAYDGHSYDERGRGRYDERDSMGRYSSDYSRDDSMSALQGMMNRAKDEHEREVLRKAMDSMRNR